MAKFRFFCALTSQPSLFLNSDSSSSEVHMKVSWKYVLPAGTDPMPEFGSCLKFRADFIVIEFAEIVSCAHSSTYPSLVV